MQTPTFAQFLIGALFASSAVAFQASILVKVGSALAVAALPIVALPTTEGTHDIEVRHHKGQRTRTGGGRNKNNKREDEEVEAPELVARHHKGQRTRTGGGRNKNNKREDEGVEAPELVTRHHKGQRTRTGGGRNGN